MKAILKMNGNINYKVKNLKSNNFDIDINIRISNDNIEILKVKKLKKMVGLTGLIYELLPFFRSFYGEYIKEDVKDKVLNDGIYDIPKEWIVEIYLENMDIQTSFSIHSFFHAGLDKYDYFINDKKIELKKYNSMTDIVEKEKQYMTNNKEQLKEEFNRNVKELEKYIFRTLGSKNDK